MTILCSELPTTCHHKAMKSITAREIMYVCGFICRVVVQSSCISMKQWCGRWECDLLCGERFLQRLTIDCAFDMFFEMQRFHSWLKFFQQIQSRFDKDRVPFYMSIDKIGCITQVARIPIFAVCIRANEFWRAMHFEINF